MSESDKLIIEIERDDVKKHVIYWEQKNPEQWDLLLKCWQDEGEDEASESKIIVYGRIKVVQGNTTSYTALVPIDGRRHVLVAIGSHDANFTEIGRSAALDVAMKKVMEANHPMGKVFEGNIMQPSIGFPFTQ